MKKLTKRALWFLITSLLIYTITGSFQSLFWGISLSGIGRGVKISVSR